jgi:hypothetical protein
VDDEYDQLSDRYEDAYGQIMVQAKAQSRDPVSYDFLWQSMGITDRDAERVFLKVLL